MSSILKALRKLEEEKARSEGGTPDIARNILRTGPRPKRNPWILPGSVAALFLVFGLTGYILGGKAEFAPPPTEPPLPAVAPAEPAPPATEPPVPAADPPPVLPPPATLSEPPGPPAPPAEAQKAIPSRPPSAAPLPDVSKAIPNPVENHSGIAEKETAGPLPSLVLMGIAFQDEREGRMAIVNDLPVMEGTMIEGARVVEISRDRVRFDFSGRSFEVILEEPAAAK